jgi:hypothetical protein
VALQVTAIMLGVNDLARSKKFYAEGMGGYSGYFSDPDRYLWKVATSA